MPKILMIRRKHPKIVKGWLSRDLVGSKFDRVIFLWRGQPHRSPYGEYFSRNSKCLEEFTFEEFKNLYGTCPVRPGECKEVIIEL